MPVGRLASRISLLCMEGNDTTTSLNGTALSFTLQIREPPIAPPLLHSSEPFAQWIEQQHTRQPTCIDDGQIETYARGRCGPQVLVKHPADRFAGDQVYEDGEEMRRGPLQQIKKQWNAAKRY